MAIERPLETPSIDGMGMGEESLEIEIVDPESVSISAGGDTIFEFDEDDFENEDIPHDANLAEFIEDNLLGTIANDLVGAFRADKESRSDWERSYIEGLDLLGLKHEERTTPWDGACGVFHPLLTEAVIRFQSQAIQEIFPASGPVKTTIVGKISDEREKQAHRVQDYLNYMLTEKMTEYRSETERMLFSLPLAGSAFRKVYYDPSMGRPCSMFVPAEDFVVSYGASDLETCERATHIMKRTSNEVRKLQISGFYADIELPNSSPGLSGGADRIKDKYNELTGDEPSYDSDSRHTILEMMVDLDLEGFEDMDGDEPTGIQLPYVVSIDLSSRMILSIRRNWYEDDKRKLKRQHFVHYQYMPGLGFYGFGLIHMIGGLAKSATSLLRQLVDAGTLANLPGGLKSRGLRIKGDDTPIMPGEFRDVDVPGGTIQDNIRLLERSMKVMSAVQARLHASMRTELRLLSKVVKDFGPDEYPYEEEDQAVTREDFDDRVDVIPVSDPNAGTMAQRIMQYQAALQLAQQAPELYDLPLLHRQMLEILNIRDSDKIVPLEGDMEPTDPISENMNIINGEPVKAFAYQDHEAHIIAHKSLIEDPKIMEIMSKSPNAQKAGAELAAHIQEHLAFQYRLEIEKQLGVELPTPNQALPEDIEFRISRLVAPAAEQLTGKNKQEAQAKQAQQQAQDPIIQMQQKELQIKEMQAQSKAQAEMAKIQLDMQKASSNMQIQRDRLDQEGRIANAKLAASISENNTKEELEERKITSKEQIDGFRIGQEIAKDLTGE